MTSGNPRHRIKPAVLGWIRAELGQGDVQKGLDRLQHYKDAYQALRRLGAGNVDRGLVALEAIAERELEPGAAMISEMNALLAGFAAYGEPGLLVQDAYRSLAGVTQKVVARQVDAADVAEAHHTIARLAPRFRVRFVAEERDDAGNSEKGKNRENASSGA